MALNINITQVDPHVGVDGYSFSADPSSISSNGDKTNKVTKGIFCRISIGIVQKFNSLGNRVFSLVKEAATWVKMVLQLILGWFKGSSPDGDPVNLTTVIIGTKSNSSEKLGRIFPPYLFDLPSSKSKQYPSNSEVFTPIIRDPSQSDLSLVPFVDPKTSSEVEQRVALDCNMELAASIQKASKFLIFLPNGIQYEIMNPRFVSEQKIKEFRDGLSIILGEAAQHTKFNVQIGSDIILLIDNPQKGNPQALSNHFALILDELCRDPELVADPLLSIEDRQPSQVVIYEQLVQKSKQRIISVDIPTETVSSKKRKAPSVDCQKDVDRAVKSLVFENSRRFEKVSPAQLFKVPASSFEPKTTTYKQPLGLNPGPSLQLEEMSVVPFEEPSMILVGQSTNSSPESSVVSLVKNAEQFGFYLPNGHKYTLKNPLLLRQQEINDFRSQLSFILGEAFNYSQFIIEIDPYNFLKIENVKNRNAQELADQLVETFEVLCKKEQKSSGRLR